MPVMQDEDRSDGEDPSGAAERERGRGARTPRALPSDGLQIPGILVRTLRFLDN